MPLPKKEIFDKIYYGFMPAPVAQWIEHHIPNVGIQVRLLVGAHGPMAQFPPKADQPLAGVAIFMTYKVYILKSLRNGKRYVGYTSKNTFKRLKEHNSGCNKWTKQNRPFELIFEEDCYNKTKAIKREKFLKSGQGRKPLDNFLS